MKELHDIPGRHIFSMDVHAHAAATATEVYALMRVPFKSVVKAIRHIPSAAINGADTNTTHLNARVGTTEIANIDYTNGNNASALTAKDFANLAAAGYNVEAGDVLNVQIEKVGTGLDIPQGVIVVEIEAR